MSKRRVLVVDDDPTSPTRWRRGCGPRASTSYCQRWAERGRSLRTRAARSGVLDVMLTGFDGLEVCRRIQARTTRSVLMLTARADETDLIVGLGVGADDYLSKPSACASWWLGYTP